MSGVKRNIGYNIIYRIISVTMPLISAPYLARILGPKSIGIYSVTKSVAGIFFSSAMLGVNIYGSREIAKVKNNAEDRSCVFWQIYYIQFVLSIIMTIIYLAMTLILKWYLPFSILQSIYIISAIFDVSWFAVGMEEFRFISLRGTTLVVINTCLYFILIKSESDLYLYFVIVLGGNIFIQAYTWIMVKKYVAFYLPDYKLMFEHLKKDFILFLPNVITTIYASIDKIMIGYFVNDEEIGFYNYAESIVGMPTVLSTAVGSVMLTYISNLVATNRKNRSEKITETTSRMISWFNMAFMFGMMGGALTFVPWYLGYRYSPTAIMVIVLAPTIFITGFSTILQTQVLLPNNKDVYYTKSVLYGTIINIIMNTILIPTFHAMGACIATVMASFCMLVIQCYVGRNHIQIRKNVKDVIPYFFFGIMITLVMHTLYKVLTFNVFAKLICEIMIGGGIYVLLTFMWERFISKDDFVMAYARETFRRIIFCKRGRH